MTNTPSAKGAPWWASSIGCASIVFALTIPRLIFSARFGLIGDEAYYAIWSFYPGFGYFDHSPAVAWIIWLGRMIFGEGEFAVRSLFLASSFVVCAALYRTAIVLVGDARIGAAAAIAYAVTPGIVITFSVATPDGPSTMFWALTVWTLAEFVHSRNANWWLAAGAFVGLGLLSKYTSVFLGAGVLLYLLTSRDRLRWLGLWQVWAGGAIASALFAPVVWIDAQRGFSSFRFQLGRSTLVEHQIVPGEFLRFLVEEAIQLLPTLFIFVLIGIALFVARRARPLALPLLTSMPMLAYFLVHAMFGRVNPNWTAPLFPPLTLIGAWAAITVRPSARMLRWPLDALKYLHVPLGVAVILLAFAAVEFRALPFVGPLPVFNYVYGWDNLQAKVSKLAAENGARWVDVEDYSLAGWLGYYGRMANDPLPVFETNASFRYQYLPPMSDTLKAAPHLLFHHAYGDRVPEIAGTKALGLVTRDDETGKRIASYAVYLANG